MQCNEFNVKNALYWMQWMQRNEYNLMNAM